MTATPVEWNQGCIVCLRPTIQTSVTELTSPFSLLFASPWFQRREPQPPSRYQWQWEARLDLHSLASWKMPLGWGHTVQWHHLRGSRLRQRCNCWLHMDRPGFRHPDPFLFPSRERFGGSSSTLSLLLLWHQRFGRDQDARRRGSMLKRAEKRMPSDAPNYAKRGTRRLPRPHPPMMLSEAIDMIVKPRENIEVHSKIANRKRI